MDIIELINRSALASTRLGLHGPHGIPRDMLSSQGSKQQPGSPARDTQCSRITMAAHAARAAETAAHTYNSSTGMGIVTQQRGWRGRLNPSGFSPTLDMAAWHTYTVSSETVRSHGRRPSASSWEHIDSGSLRPAGLATRWYSSRLEGVLASQPSVPAAGGHVGQAPLAAAAMASTFAHTVQHATTLGRRILISLESLVARWVCRHGCHLTSMGQQVHPKR